ncbi:Uma2 family endonuclease [Leptolyngbya sp. FACHB-671]|uniref:Uma2 family endonuclease n=1 Tax=Leptolyngbya sp. FACHB-671 TaxID=2692812 RepID=UPI0019C4B1C1|nr:Uma2 family endonuclease [Leptolyngbya sp. FACHB-671]MBD2066217.1 Uma2 family endonuclease [Leptolyngbya sp. FACHB-671]
MEAVRKSEAIAMTQAKLLTYEEYLQRPYDGRRTEFIDGEIVELNPPRGRHTDIAMYLYRKLEGYFEDQGLLLVARVYAAQVQIPPSGGKIRGRVPDVFVCTTEQWEALQDQTAVFRVGNPPLMAIEVVSPGNAQVDIGAKRAEYADAGVQEYWIVNALEGYISVWTLGGRFYEEFGTFSADETVRSKVFPNLKLSVAQVFRARG